MRHFGGIFKQGKYFFREAKTFITIPENDIPNCVVLLKSHQKGMASIFQVFLRSQKRSNVYELLNLQFVPGHLICRYYEGTIALTPRGGIITLEHDFYQ